MKKQDEGKYIPYTKKDFRKYWCDPESSFPEMQTFEIIRQLTEKEKADWTKGEDYDYNEEMYLIKNNNGDEREVFDIEILNEYEIDPETWRCCVINLLEDMEGNDETIMEFIKECKIEQYIKKHC